MAIPGFGGIRQRGLAEILRDLERRLEQSMVHGELDGLDEDDHTFYAYTGGRPGGQTIYGGAMPGENLALGSTSDTDKGLIEVLDPLSFPNQAKTKRYTLRFNEETGTLDLVYLEQ